MNISWTSATKAIVLGSLIGTASDAQVESAMVGHTPPLELISVADYGAIENDLQDDTWALQRAFDVAAAQNGKVLIPAGTYLYNTALTVNGTSVQGIGSVSHLHATDPANSAIQMTGVGASLSSIRLSNAGSSRRSNPESSGVYIKNADRFNVQNVQIEYSAGAGILVQGSKNGDIRSNSMLGTKADSIHITGGSRHVLVEGNHISNSGDDGVAVVSYLGEGLAHDITVRRNKIINNLWGRNISVVGGDKVQITENSINGNKAAFAGIYLAGETAWRTWGVSNVLVAQNQITQVGGVTTGHGAVMIFNDTHYPLERITIRDNNIVGISFMGVRVLGNTTNAISIDGNYISGTEAGIVGLDAEAHSVISRNNTAVSQDYTGPLPSADR